jgi:NitT/TauT family transport system substrate-binding protein
MKISLQHLCVLLVCVLFSGACQRETSTSAGPPEKITIAYPQTVYAIPFWIAITKGFFSAEGLEITAHPHEFGKSALKSVLEGKADLAISGDTTVMFAIVAGNQLSVIAVIITAKKNEAIVARKDLGVKTPLDLNGKRIGVVFGSTGHFFLESFLSIQGIDRKNVTCIDMGVTEMRDALTKGQIDAVAIWNPVTKKLEKELGSNGVVFYDDSIYSDNVCVSGFQEFIKKHPETIKKVLKALIRADVFIKENPDEFRRLVAEFLKMDEADVDEICGVMNFEVVLDQSLLVRLEDQTRWAQEKGHTDIRDAPNYLDYIYFDGLQSVKPKSVRIIR